MMFSLKMILLKLKYLMLGVGNMTSNREIIVIAVLMAIGAAVVIMDLIFWRAV